MGKEQSAGERLLAAAKEAVDTANGLPTGATWQLMDAKTVAAYGPWVRKADYDATIAAKDAELVERDAEIETLTVDLARKHEAYTIAHDQATSNGQALADCRKCYEGAQHRYETAESSLAEREAEMGRMGEIAERLADYGLTLDTNIVICDRRVVDEAVTALSERAATRTGGQE